MEELANLDTALQYLNDGKVIAYPTEAVYGLGCNPFNKEAVFRILDIKNRSQNKGLIILISDWEQLKSLVSKIPDERLEIVKKSWPGHITWLFPKSEIIPSWVSGIYDTIAIRMTSHPIAAKLCKHFPIISTSANRQNEPPIRDIYNLKVEFEHDIDALVLGSLGCYDNPSKIYDATTGLQLR